MDTDKHTILVLEDEIPLQDAIKAKLEISGFAVVTCRTVEQALGYLKDIEKVAVIWLDHYLLGQKDGLDFVAEVKNNEVWKHIPIFVVSNTASQEKVGTYLSLGVTKYFTKSDYRLDQIIADIKEVLKNNQ